MREWIKNIVVPLLLWLMLLGMPFLFGVWIGQKYTPVANSIVTTVPAFATYTCETTDGDVVIVETITAPKDKLGDLILAVTMAKEARE